MKLEELSAFEIGSLVNERKISPVEVVEYFLDRIEKRNESVNAFVYVKADYAIEKAVPWKDEERTNAALSMYDKKSNGPESYFLTNPLNISFLLLYLVTRIGRFNFLEIALAIFNCSFDGSKQ